MRVLFLFFPILLFSKQIVVAIQNINLGERVTKDKVISLELNQQTNCKPIDILKLSLGNYVAKHYIIKGKPVCNKDIKIAKKEFIEFDFGGIIIKKEGKIISRTNNYVKIRKPDGKIEKIYLNGLSK